MSVTIKFAGGKGGIQADTRKLVAPLMALVSETAGIVRARVQNTGKGPNGMIFGKYFVKVNRQNKDRIWRWIPPGLPRSSAAIAIDNQGRQLVPGYGGYQRGRQGAFKSRVAAGNAINFTYTGGMWEGLTATMQKSGARVLINFKGRSAGKGRTIRKPGKNGRIEYETKDYTELNRNKAFYSSIGYAREGNHILGFTDQEFQAFQDVFFAKALASIFKDAADAQRFLKESLKRAGGDPKTKQKLRRAKNGGSSTRKIKRK